MSIVDCNGGNLNLPADFGSDFDDSNALVQTAPAESPAIEPNAFGGFELPSLVGQFGQTGDPPLGELPLILGVVVCALVVVLLLFLARCALVPGYLRTHQLAVTQQEVQVATLFRPEGRFVPVVLVNLLLFVIGLLGLLAVFALAGLPLYLANNDPTALATVLVASTVLILPVVIYVSLGLSFAEHAVVLEKLPPHEAIQRSWQLTRGIRWPLIGYVLLSVVVGIVAFLFGVILLCVGLLFTMPMARMINDAAYTTLFLQRTGTLSFADPF